MEYYIKLGITLIIILLIFWMADSQRKNQNKKIKQMQDDIKVDDKIITYSGMSGKVVRIEEERVIIQLNPSNVEVAIEKWAIAGIDEK
ncbi:MAG: preprotein translocase subunit YajC [Christensenellales bacterium]